MDTNVKKTFDMSIISDPHVLCESLIANTESCLLYTSDAADDSPPV